jgi:hypothetical protein
MQKLNTLLDVYDAARNGERSVADLVYLNVAIRATSFEDGVVAVNFVENAGYELELDVAEYKPTQYETAVDEFIYQRRTPEYNVF